MQRILLPRKLLCEIRITFPVGLQISIIQPREAIKFCSTVPCEAAVTERVSIRVSNHFFGRSGVAGEISSSLGIAPGAPRIPMPGLHEQIGVLAITDDSPASGENLLDLIGSKKYIGGIAGYSVYCRSQRVKRAECVDRVAGRCVDTDCLRDSVCGPREGIQQEKHCA